MEEYSGEQFGEDVWTALRKAMMDGPKEVRPLPMWVELSLDQRIAMMEVFLHPMFTEPIRVLLHIALGNFEIVEVVKSDDPKMN